MKLSNVEDHTDNKCPACLVICPYGCDASMNKCPTRLVMCPNAGICGASMKHSTIKFHTEKECSLSVVNCEFAHAGCLLMMWRMDMNDHLKAAKQEHIELLSEKVKGMESD